MIDTQETIAAIATAREGALQGIVRITGPRALECVARFFRPENGETLATLEGSRVLAGVLVAAGPIGEVPGSAYVWPTDRSYTRQPSVELHTLGALPVLDAVLLAACRAGARLAQPGEFTLRAFLAGRLDLTQAEAVLGVIEARGASDLDAALQQLAGGLSRPLHRLRDRLLDLLAHLEAGLDFVEEDIEFITREQLLAELAGIQRELESLVQQLADRGETSEQPRVVLVGSPNVGKSSLFNALARQSAAIVSAIPGTTRDYLVQPLEVHGHRVLLVDTAGYETAEIGEIAAALSQQMTAEQSQQAMLQVFCLDSTRRLNDWEREQLARGNNSQRLVVKTKCDEVSRCDFVGPAVETSSAMGVGLEALVQAIHERLDTICNSDAAVLSTTAARCRQSLERALEALQGASEQVMCGGGEELVAAELRLALDDLGMVVGAVYTDDVLDRIFSRFCIGK